MLAVSNSNVNLKKQPLREVVSTKRIILVIPRSSCFYNELIVLSLRVRNHLDLQSVVSSKASKPDSLQTLIEKTLKDKLTISTVNVRSLILNIVFTYYTN